LRYEPKLGSDFDGELKLALKVFVSQPVGAGCVTGLRIAVPLENDVLSDSLLADRTMMIRSDNAVQFSKTIALLGAAGKVSIARYRRQPVRPTYFQHFHSSKTDPQKPALTIIEPPCDMHRRLKNGGYLSQPTRASSSGRSWCRGLVESLQGRYFSASDPCRQ